MDPKPDPTPDQATTAFEFQQNPIEPSPIAGVSVCKGLPSPVARERQAMTKIRPHTASGTKTAAALLASAAIFAAWPSVAKAQHALGDGRGLESRLEITAERDRTAPQRRWQQEMSFRNAVVTGNAPGGMSFRGDVGYFAPGDFRADLGSTDLFAFRRDSLYSGLSGYGLRGTDALQYQFALTTGGRAPSDLIGFGAVSRDGAGMTGAAVGAPAPIGRPIGDTGVRRADPVDAALDDPLQRGDLMTPSGVSVRDAALLGTLRSTSAFTSVRGFSPTLVGIIEPDEERRFGLTASTLQGLQYIELRDRRRDRRAETLVQPVDRPQTVSDRLRDQLRQSPIAPDPRTDRPGVDPRPGEHDTDPELPDWQRHIQQLEQELRDLREQEPDDPAAVAADTMRWLRAIDADQPIRELVDRDATDPYSTQIRRGSELISRGSYFDAEERFTRALSARPDDPTASLGRIHAQLGAGMYRSASLNLRSVLSDRPELALMRFDAALLPDPARMEEVRATLRRNLTSTDPDLRRESGLLLAYLGRQTGSRTDVRDGLSAFGAGVTRGDQVMGDLLRGLWLRDTEDPSEPETQEDDPSGR